MKPSLTILWIVLVGVMASSLFQLKYAVQEREDELSLLNRKLIASERAVHVLLAEWSYLNRPDHLAGLTARHLELSPMTPGQVGAMGLAALPVAGTGRP